MNEVKKKVHPIKKSFAIPLHTNTVIINAALIIDIICLVHRYDSGDRILLSPNFSNIGIVVAIIAINI